LGSAPGQHSVFFDSPADTIEITHTARSREGFAAGAIRAAQWLVSDKRLGIFTIDDMLKDLGCF
jgi:4-hydroxy-tetrahydrodipicolinate reductase